MQFPFFIIIFGPTGVGKSAIAETLSSNLSYPCEIINADIGQMYTPLTIGTAKPDYVHSPVKQHLFDVINEPIDITVAQYREKVLTLMHDLWNRSVVPLLVGGSGFYVSSLFFPPFDIQSTFDNKKIKNELVSFETAQTDELWNLLHAIDPERAQSIHPRDRYRIERALSLWYHSGIAPSRCLPLFDPPGRCLWYGITRERGDLIKRIDARVDEMFAAGWVQEVGKLDSSWQSFLKRKKLIGYDDVIDYLKGEQTPEGYNALKETVCVKTRAYAKRQMTYWRMLKRKFAACDPHHEYVRLVDVDVTHGIDWKVFESGANGKSS